MRISMCSIVFDLLISLGYMMIFKKCGIKLFWAFIPFAREYQISLCSDKENDGRVFAFVAGIEFLMEGSVFFLKRDYLLSGCISVNSVSGAFVIGRIVLCKSGSMWVLRRYSGRQ